MLGSDILTFFQNIVDDTIDTTVAYQLMNNAKNKIEGERDWEMLKKVDSSLSASNAALALPTDYDHTVNLYVNTTPYIQVSFDQKFLFQNAALRWYLDMANSNFYILGSNISGTVNHVYIKTTPDITSSTSPVWPNKFHLLLAFEMAIIYFAIDQGLKVFSWETDWAAQYQTLKNSMIDWDVKLQKRAVENLVPADYDIPIDIGLF